MAEGIEDLTQKEKEALRLLLAGHETNSIARKLDLSVHTINDRLRHSRRKLGTSSSREAARILGEAEGFSPKSDVGRKLGVAGSPGGVDRGDAVHERRSRGRPVLWLTGGMLTMSTLIAAAIVLTQAGGDRADDNPRLASEEPAVSSQASAAAALPDAREWVALVDQGDWDASWAAAGKIFRSQVSASQWPQIIRPVREPLGAVRSRQFLRVTDTDSLPNAPRADYEIIEFTTAFANRPTSVETVVMARQDGGWKVEGYFIRPG